jgi:hypothetical protein
MQSSMKQNKLDLIVKTKDAWKTFTWKKKTTQ